MGKDEEEKEMSSFSSSSFDAAIIATAMKATSTDNAEALAKNGSKEETTDKAPGADRLFDACLLLLIDATQKMSTAIDN